MHTFVLEVSVQGEKIKTGNKRPSVASLKRSDRQQFNSSFKTWTGYTASILFDFSILMMEWLLQWYWLLPIHNLSFFWALGNDTSAPLRYLRAATAVEGVCCSQDRHLASFGNHGCQQSTCRIMKLFIYLYEFLSRWRGVKTSSWPVRTVLNAKLLCV